MTACEANRSGAVVDDVCLLGLVFVVGDRAAFSQRG
jgi:hypothetical protein